MADLRVTNALIDGAGALGEKPFVGIATTRDAFHRRDQALAELLSKEGGVVAAEQECATVFIVATVRRVRAGAVLGIDSNIFLPQKDPEEVQPLFREAEARTIGVAHQGGPAPGRTGQDEELIGNPCSGWRSGPLRRTIYQQSHIRSGAAG